MPYASQADRNAASRRYYEGNRAMMIARAAAHKAATRDAVRAVIRQAKQAPCTDCGQSYPPYVMQFDHVGDDKLGDVGNAASRSWSVTRTLDEIAKCELVCANCHAERTHQRRAAEAPRAAASSADPALF